EQKVNLTITDTALAQLAKEGYDPLYGARPLRRLIQTAIENPIALLLIQKTFVEGDTILVDYDGTKAAFVFTKTASAPIESGQAQGQTPPAAVTNGALNQTPSNGMPSSPMPPPPTVSADGTQMQPAQPAAPQTQV
ncbi:MAG TPA: hypothetical protein VLF68_03755, partial [Candidatus Saccharimonadales bacterium]|nr:hypothetical protein [Candidatus Saccharimonadales bacterium]